MENTRFLSILNLALHESGLDLATPTSPTDPAAVAAWADFLRRCVSEGISITDPRWRALEMRTAAGAHRLVLVPRPDEVDASPTEDGADFTLGLSLLMSMLGPGSDRDA